MAKYCVIGNGFLATALKKKLGPDCHWYPDKDTETIFYLGGTTHMDFEKNFEWFLKKELTQFNAVLEYCVANKIHLIYPSSALVYERPTKFSTFKLFLEDMAEKEHKELSLGVRMFPVYGPGENKTVISKWCREMKAGKRPEVFGDGTQTRDFVHIDDVVWYLIDLAKSKTKGLIDIGHGHATSFNDIVDRINKILGINLKPIYIPAPETYAKGIFSQNPLPVRTPLAEGIKKILND